MNKDFSPFLLSDIQEKDQNKNQTPAVNIKIKQNICLIDAERERIPRRRRGAVTSGPRNGESSFERERESTKKKETRKKKKKNSDFASKKR